MCASGADGSRKLAGGWHGMIHSMLLSLNPRPGSFAGIQSSGRCLSEVLAGWRTGPVEPSVMVFAVAAAEQALLFLPRHCAVPFGCRCVWRYPFQTLRSLVASCIEGWSRGSCGYGWTILAALIGGAGAPSVVQPQRD
ncbi:hypothetical protein T440DRAFT_91938 [Plenodomus tracheiphilus IPT5]|uniref:Uncharacterized protein n=1 Tax=Plenodomus tracheiphilus IPT5 TaxID=1408161 RepID=A0A6A7B5P2_9PLEO|nr:hypothetical protein T440DRAFT_91938 [Plenodomus tracheiphilus IPT5]